MSGLQVTAHIARARIVMAYIVTAYIAMAYIVMAYIVIANIDMAYSYGLCSQGVDSGTMYWRVSNLDECTMHVSGGEQRGTVPRGCLLSSLISVASL